MLSSQLHKDIGLLNELLERVISEQTSNERCQLVQQFRRLARARRADVQGADEELINLVQACSLEELEDSIRALSLYFDLANLSEDLQRIRVLRLRETSQESATRSESISAGIQRLASAGLSAAQMQGLLDRLTIELVFTSHPTEAKRRTTRRLIRQLRGYLGELNESLPSNEQETLQQRICAILTLLWQNDPFRPQPPTVMQEVERGLFFVDGLWEIAPRIQRAIKLALDENFPGKMFRIPPIVRFGSWIGGDRDGNPFVTAATTRRTLELQRRAALDRHLRSCRELGQLLVMSSRRTPVEEALMQRLQEYCQRWPGAAAYSEEVSTVEVYRKWLRVVEYRLTQSEFGGSNDPGNPGYKVASELRDDIVQLTNSLKDHKGERIVQCYLEDWLAQIDVFGLQFASLDVRQDGRLHEEQMTELLKVTGKHDNFAGLSEEERIKVLVAPVGFNEVPPGLSELTCETLSLFELIAQTVQRQGLEPFGAHVISMTHRASDVLVVWWLWNWAWSKSNPGQQKSLPPLPIVPLFETIDDLTRGPEILDSLLSIPEYQAYLRSAGNGSLTQMVMVGYSDSTKDGGYLAASWGLSRCQEKLAAVADRHGVRLVVFHGRGGALGRGGGPAARAILSLPPSSVRGAVRITEQGEVLAERYDDPRIAMRHLEQVSWATLLVTGLPGPLPAASWVALVERMSIQSFKKYRELVEHRGFLQYFDQATPIGEIERLPIGSRPSRRRERRSLSDLRAIPWTFAWTQSRHFLPAWFGLGNAVHDAIHSGTVSWEQLQTMYLEWPLFQAVIDNAALALAKADPWIGERYANQVDNPEVRTEIWSMIREEYRSSRSAVRMITNQPELLAGTPWLQTSILERNPYVDPLNLIQIELIRRRQQAEVAGDEILIERLRQMIRLSIQGIAAGLRTTG